MGNNGEDITAKKERTAEETSPSQKDLFVVEEITELLISKNILHAIEKFKADTPEKEIAFEFVKAHVQFLRTIVENDYKKKVARGDTEIQDLVSHVNMMLQKKDEYLFYSLAVNSPAHYRSIQNEYVKSAARKKESQKQ